MYEYISENEVPTSPKVEQFPHFDAYYNVYGDEMMPEFKPGDKLAIAPYEAGMERKVLDGRTYVIDTKYNGLLLRVLRKAEGGFVAIPYNNKYSEEFIENEYIKVMILPELGGRVQMAYDKVKQRHFVYYNHVIKPALVGLAGPWISGGIEFNWPQHHRPSTYMPVDCTIEENEDGSVTVWVSAE